MDDRIYTGRGDDGTTSLTSGRRVRKNDDRVKAYGSVDEACSAVGLASAIAEAPLRDMLRFVAQKLYNCAGAIASAGAAGAPSVSEADVSAIERAIDEVLPPAPFRGFVLPGGTDLSARLHLARSLVRRSERDVMDLAETEDVPAEVLAFLNRCSDLLFAAAIAEQERAGAEERWDPNAGPSF